LYRPCSGDCVDRVGFALTAAGPTVGPVDLDDVDPVCGQIAGQTGAVRAGALHSDMDHITELSQPGEQVSVSSRGGGEPLVAEGAADPVQCRSGVGISVSVDATGDRCPSG
jgi:hypothetical protein